MVQFARPAWLKDFSRSMVHQILTMALYVECDALSSLGYSVSFARIGRKPMAVDALGSIFGPRSLSLSFSLHLRGIINNFTRARYRGPRAARSGGLGLVGGQQCPKGLTTRHFQKSRIFEHSASVLTLSFLVSGECSRGASWTS